MGAWQDFIDKYMMSSDDSFQVDDDEDEDQETKDDFLQFTTWLNAQSGENPPAPPAGSAPRAEPPSVEAEMYCKFCKRNLKAGCD